MTDDHVLPEMTEPVEKVVTPTLEELLKDLKWSREERDRAKTARDERLKELMEDVTYK
jgi:vacuolar-type H+-ATPase subunit D/Vma8